MIGVLNLLFQVLDINPEGKEFFVGELHLLPKQLFGVYSGI